MGRRNSIPDRVRHFLHSLPDAANGVVIAVSGGADSIALLRALDAARDPRSPIPLVIAHLNHQLRGAESDADEGFIAEMHARLCAEGRPQLMLCRQRIDIAALARSEGANLEAVARRERYRWLAEMGRRHGMRWISTGHTANDQAETVLHRLLRGTGLRGLRGIAPRRDLGSGITVTRPLLTTMREEILFYLEELGQSYREDRTNHDLTLTRNRIRHELLPLLTRDYNPVLVSLLAQLAQQAEDAYRIEEAQARALLAEAELPPAGALRIFRREPLLTASPHRVREMFRLVWLREDWPLSGMNHAAWDRVAGVVFDGCSAVDLPGGLHARRIDRVVQVGKQTLSASAELPGAHSAAGGKERSEETGGVQFGCQRPTVS